MVYEIRVLIFDWGWLWNVSVTLFNVKVTLILLDLDLPKIITEFDGLTTNRSTVHVKEGTTVSLKCMGTGNPKPDVYIATILNARRTLSSNSLNELLLENIQCEDTRRYTCTARSPGINDTSTYVEIFVNCKRMHTKYFYMLMNVISFWAADLLRNQSTTKKPILFEVSSVL